MTGVQPPLDVFERIAAVREALGPMEQELIEIKGQRASYSFKAFKVDAIYSKVRPLFDKFGLLVMPEYVDVEYAGNMAHAVIDYHFYAVGYRRQLAAYGEAAGEGSVFEVNPFKGAPTEVTMRFRGSGQDQSDKHTNKAAQAAYKYGLIQLLMISTGEDDPDETAPVPDVSDQVEHVKQHPEVARVKRAAFEVAGEDVTEAGHLYALAMEQHGYEVDVPAFTTEQATELVDWIKAQATDG